MSKITPFLWYDTQAEEAMNHYMSIFKNSKKITVTHYGPNSPMPEGTVMTAVFELDGQRFIALNAGPVFKFNESVSFVINCDTQDEIDHYWNSFIDAGGKASQCGWLKDKFGLSWQVVPSILGQLFAGTEPEKSKRAFQAMMSMQKFDIKKLKDAYDGK